MEDILKNITIEIEKYNNLNDELVFNDTQELSGILKNLSSSLFFLEYYRDQASRDYNSVLNNKIKNNMSVNKAEIIANNEHPELYMLRRIMTSAYKVLDSIRTNISFLKQEK